MAKWLNFDFWRSKNVIFVFFRVFSVFTFQSTINRFFKIVIFSFFKNLGTYFFDHFCGPQPHLAPKTGFWNRGRKGPQRRHRQSHRFSRKIHYGVSGSSKSRKMLVLVSGQKNQKYKKLAGARQAVFFKVRFFHFDASLAMGRVFTNCTTLFCATNKPALISWTHTKFSCFCKIAFFAFF